ncbi:JAB domain-containing protein [Paenibacillus sp. LjRoot153]|uniref:JAB domain-containing protein n=1 Tax=Paenibacillus sp. LjRoot153 TaxID=3342270 RepID=UPI003F4F81D0
MENIDIVKIKMVKESSFLYSHPSLSNTINAPKAIVDIVEDILEISSEAVEICGMLLLDTKNKINGLHIISRGTLNYGIVNPRDVFKAALLANAASIVLFHNHPSGDPTPSPEDISLTNRLCEVGELLSINVLDHIIIGDNKKFRSLREQGYI